MGSFSIGHWLAIVLVLILPAWLFSRVIAKAGFSPWWALLGAIPVANLVALWVFAFANWPRFPKQRFPEP